MAGWTTSDLASATFARSRRFQIIQQPCVLLPPTFDMESKRLNPHLLANISPAQGMIWTVKFWIIYLLYYLGMVDKEDQQFSLHFEHGVPHEEKVSSPWSKRKALNGDKAAPVSRSNWTRTAIIKAAAPTSRV